MAFSAIFLAALGGVTEAIAGKSIEAAPVLARRARLLGMVERQPASAAEQAVAAGVEAARQEVVDLYAFTEEALQAGEVQDLLRLLNHPPFAQEVAQALLLRGQPDFDRLRRSYLGQDGARGERWTRLQPYLDDFFSAIESHLLADPTLGPLLRESRVLAVQLRLAEDVDSLNAASQQMVDYQARSAEAGEETATGIAGLLAAAGRQEANLGEIVQLLAGWQTDSGPAGIDQREQRVLGNQVIVSGSATTVVGGNVEQIGDRYYAATPDPTEQRAIDAERRYLRALAAECDDVPLAGDGNPDTPQQRRPRLQQIYVELHSRARPEIGRILTRLGIPTAQQPAAQRTIESIVRSSKLMDMTEQRRVRVTPSTSLDPLSLAFELIGDSRETIEKIEKALQLDEGAWLAASTPLNLLEELARQTQWVLLGDPGSGKSTFTRWLAGRQAGVVLGREKATPLPGLPADTLPVRVVLSSWASHLAENATGSADDLLVECLRLLRPVAVDEAGLKEHLLKRLGSETPSLLLLLDGLDEVADVAQRKILLASIRHFCRKNPEVRVVVTCRVRPYREREHYRLPLAEAEIGPLNSASVSDFLQRWHAELLWAAIYTPEAAATAQTRLLTALGDTRRKELQEMAETPLLLTMMARVNYKRGLPNSRAALYEEFVKQLLWEWERQKRDDQGQPTNLEILLQDAGISPVSLERALNQLAWSVHGQAGNRDTVEIASAALRETLERIHPADAPAKAAWAVRALALIDDRSGLIYATEQRQHYRFSHRTFQEYLAARWLASGDFLSKFREKLDEEQWREALFLALGYQISVVGEYDNALAVFDELLPAGVENERDRRRVALLGEAYARLLGPQRAREAGQPRRAERVMTAMPQRLTGLMQHRDTPAAQRLEAGLILADLGDLPPDLDEFVPISAKAALGYDFKIGKYPVTNVQFRCFFDAGGYAADRPWWTAQAVKDIERWSSNEGWRKGPRLWDNERFNRATQPVVGVSWYEAVAYCEWLTGELRGRGEIGQNEVVRLAQEAEWAFVAAPPGPPSDSPRAGGRADASSGKGSLSVDSSRRAGGRADRSSGKKSGQESREYAWGDGFDGWRVNSKESGHGQPTPVHMHPGGATPDTAVWDLCGNAWEWGLEDRSSDKILMGGAFWNNADTVRSSSRYRNDPWPRFDLVGLRCVVVPGSR